MCSAHLAHLANTSSLISKQASSVQRKLLLEARPVTKYCQSPTTLVYYKRQINNVCYRRHSYRRYQWKIQ